MNCVAHSWIELEEARATPDDPPLSTRGPYSPVIGPGEREMKVGRTYLCQHCGTRLTPPGNSRDQR